ncbi:hypothetical protein D3C71_1968830 [compost metagenome]
MELGRGENRPGIRPGSFCRQVARAGGGIHYLESTPAQLQLDSSDQFAQMMSANRMGSSVQGVYFDNNGLA